MATVYKLSHTASEIDEKLGLISTKNLLQDAKYVEGYRISGKSVLSANANYDHYVLTLPPGKYKVCAYSSSYNLVTGAELTSGNDEEATFILNEESKIGVNSYQGHTSKLFSFEYTADEVEDLGVYTLDDNVVVPQFVQLLPSQEFGEKEDVTVSQKVITSKTLHALGKSTDIGFTDANLAYANSIIRTSNSASIANLPTTSDGTLVTFRGAPADDITVTRYCDFQIYVDTGGNYWYRIYTDNWGGWRNAFELTAGAVTESKIADGVVTPSKLSASVKEMFNIFAIKGAGQTSSGFDANDAELNTIINYLTPTLNIPDGEISSGILLTIASKADTNTYRQLAFTSKGKVFARAYHKGTWLDWARLDAPADNSITAAMVKDEAITKKKLSSDIQATLAKVENGKMDAVESYVAEEAERVANLVRSHQNASTFSVLCLSDLHLTSDTTVATAIKHATQGAKIVSEKVKIDYFTSLGDLVMGSDYNGDKARLVEINSLMHGIRSGVDVRFATTGNHDPLDNSIDTSGKYLTQDELYTYIGTYCDGIPNFESSGAGCKYYDDKSKKLRIITLNTTDIAEITLTASDSPAGFTTSQLEWLCNALDVEEGYSILILSHHPLDWTYQFDFAALFTMLFTAYDRGTTFNYTINEKEVSYDFANHNAGKIIGNIHGHLHNYLTSQLFEGNTNNIYRICCPNSCPSRNNAYNGKWKEETTIEKVAGTANDTSFCVVTFDTKNNNIYVDYYGARNVDTKDIDYDITSQTGN